MRKTALMTVIASVLGFLFGCSNASPATLIRKPEGRILIVCYSESANQNTMTAATWIQQQVGGDLCAVKMVAPYSESYRDVLKEAKNHLDNGIKPEILPLDKDVSNYDIVFVGSPVWYGTFAPPLGTFFSKNDLSGKTVIPFCTHGGGGAGHLFEDVAKAAPESKILPGLELKGSNVVERTLGRGTASKASPNDVVNWLNDTLKED